MLASGRAIGQKIGQGTVRLIRSAAEMDRVKAGDVLVTDMTDPDWEPVMKRAAAIVTNRGGRTCHAAIIARELGIPGGRRLRRRDDRAHRRRRRSPFPAPRATPATSTRACPRSKSSTSHWTRCRRADQDHDERRQSRARVRVLQAAQRGVGLARLEFIINRNVGMHPKALIEFDSASRGAQGADQPSASAATTSPTEFYVSKIAEGVATIAAAFCAEEGDRAPVGLQVERILEPARRQRYEPHEENPMIGFRGASRYVAPEFYDCFAARMRALKRVRDDMGLTNVEVMIPFVRTLGRGRAGHRLLAKNGLEARRQRIAADHDVRDSVERRFSPIASSSTSTASRSAPTT